MTLRTNSRPRARRARLADPAKAKSDPILFAFTDDQFTVSSEDRPRASLLQARALARELGAQLHVLAVIKPREPFAPVVPPGMTQALLTQWLTGLLGEDSVQRLELSSGRFFSDVADAAKRLGARLIIVAPQRIRSGRSTAKLVRSVGVPVLVAREPAPASRTIVAATDLADPLYPVLREATRFAGLLHAPLVAVHNVNPLLIRRRSPRPALSPALEQRTRRLQLAERAGVLTEGGAAILETRVSTAAAIVHAAASYSAGMVVIGSRAHKRVGASWFAGLVARVVNGARCSVLVTPIRPV